MTRITIKDNIIEFKGHAEYDYTGKDIVCSAISSIVTTTVNAATKLGGKIKVVEDNGLIIEILDETKTTKTLIDNMLDLLRELKEQYPKNIGGDF